MFGLLDGTQEKDVSGDIGMNIQEIDTARIFLYFAGKFLHLSGGWGQDGDMEGSGMDKSLTPAQQQVIQKLREGMEVL